MPPSRRRVLATLGGTVTLSGCSGLAGTTGNGSLDATGTATPEPPAATPTGGWTGARHDAANTSHAPVTGPSAPSLVWRRNLAGRPLPRDDVVLVGGRGAVRALDPEDGRDRWATELGTDEQVRTPAVADGRVIALTEDGTLGALDAADGSVAWTVAHDGFGGTPAVVGGLVVAAVGGVIRAYGLADGTERWRHEPQQGRAATVGIRDRDCYVAVAGPEPALKRLTTGGAERWRRSIVPARPVVGRDAVYVSQGGDQAPTGLYALDRTTGEQRWERPLGSLASPAVTGNRLFLSHGGGETVALDAATGETVWTAPTATLYGEPVTADAARVYGPGEHSRTVRALSRTDGTPEWHVDVGFDPDHVTVTGDAVYVAGDGWIARLTDRE